MQIGQSESHIRGTTQVILPLLVAIWLHGRVRNKKVVARSSAEAEHRGMANGVYELLWLRNLLRDLGFQQIKESHGSLL